MIYKMSEQEMLDFEKQHNLFEMANLVKAKSGLPYDVWIDSSGINRNVPHNMPRLKVDVDGDGRAEVPISIDDCTPKVLVAKYRGFKHENVVLSWVKEHYDILIDHWNKVIDDEDALHFLRRDAVGQYTNARKNRAR